MQDRPTSKLRAWRKGSKMTVSEAALRAGVTRQTWHKWERGGTIPPERFMAKLAEMTAGDVTPNDFDALPACAEGQAA